MLEAFSPAVREWFSSSFPAPTPAHADRLAAGTQIGTALLDQRVPALRHAHPEPPAGRSGPGDLLVPELPAGRGAGQPVVAQTLMPYLLARASAGAKTLLPSASFFGSLSSSSRPLSSAL